MTYYDTTQLELPLLAVARAITAEQDAQVLAIFAKHPDPLTPSQVWAMGPKGANGHPVWLLTSVRRSITTLTKCQQLEKLDTQQLGLYRRPEFQWKRAAVAA